MIKTQKLIKYFGIALAVVLIFNIFFSIFRAFNFLGDYSKENNNEFSEEIFNDNIDYLDIDLNVSKLTFKESDVFKVETNNNEIKIKENNHNLIIKEKSNIFSSKHYDDEVIIYIPRNKTFKEVEIDAGSGTIDISNINSDKIDLDLGAGTINIDDLNILFKAEIHTGAGKLVINKSKINNLDLDMGAGEVIINSNLQGNSEITAGVGSLTLNLDNNLLEYGFRIEKGIGEILINNEKVNDGYETNGDNKIKIDGGVGKIKITTLENN